MRGIQTNFGAGVADIAQRNADRDARRAQAAAQTGQNNELALKEQNLNLQFQQWGAQLAALQRQERDRQKREYTLAARDYNMLVDQYAKTEDPALLDDLRVMAEDIKTRLPWAWEMYGEEFTTKYNNTQPNTGPVGGTYNDAQAYAQVAGGTSLAKGIIIKDFTEEDYNKAKSYTLAPRATDEENANRFTRGKNERKLRGRRDPLNVDEANNRRQAFNDNDSGLRDTRQNNSSQIADENKIDAVLNAPEQDPNSPVSKMRKEDFDNAGRDPNTRSVANMQQAQAQLDQLANSQGLLELDIDDLVSIQRGELGSVYAKYPNITEDQKDGLKDMAIDMAMMRQGSNNDGTFYMPMKAMMDMSMAPGKDLAKRMMPRPLSTNRLGANYTEEIYNEQDIKLQGQAAHLQNLDYGMQNAKREQTTLQKQTPGTMAYNNTKASSSQYDAKTNTIQSNTKFEQPTNISQGGSNNKDMKPKENFNDSAINAWNKKYPDRRVNNMDELFKVSSKEERDAVLDKTNDDGITLRNIYSTKEHADPELKKKIEASSKLANIVSNVDFKDKGTVAAVFDSLNGIIPAQFANKLRSKSEAAQKAAIDVLKNATAKDAKIGSYNNTSMNANMNGAIVKGQVTEDDLYLMSQLLDSMANDLGEASNSRNSYDAYIAREKSEVYKHISGNLRARADILKTVGKDNYNAIDDITMNSDNQPEIIYKGKRYIVDKMEGDDGYFTNGTIKLFDPETKKFGTYYKGELTFK